MRSSEEEPSKIQQIDRDFYRLGYQMDLLTSQHKTRIQPIQCVLRLNCLVDVDFEGAEIQFHKNLLTLNLLLNLVLTVVGALHLHHRAADRHHRYRLPHLGLGFSLSAFVFSSIFFFIFSLFFFLHRCEVLPQVFMSRNFLPF